jgi:AraC-like DNA-binding protein
VNSIFAHRLDRVAGHRFVFRRATSWAEVIEAILREPLEMAVVDPSLEHAPRAHEIERLRVMFPSMPVILYTALTPDVVPVLLQLGQRHVHDVVVAEHDDHPQKLGEVLIHGAAYALSQQLADQIEDLLAGCPGELRWAINTIVREPAAFRTVQELAERARMDRRTCARWFTRAKLPPPSTVLMVFRVVYAHRLLQDPGYTVEDVAAKLGYAKARSFAAHVKEVFGVTPGELRVTYTSEEAIAVVRERFFNRSTAERAS